MKFPTTFTLQQIAEIINSDYIGNADFPVLGMNEIHVVEEGDIVFVDHPKYYDKALSSKATIVLINKKVDCPVGKALLISDDPFRDFNKLTVYFKPFVPSERAISITSKIGANTLIQPNVFIGNNVRIGNNCLIHANVSIYDNCIIGNGVTIHSGTVLGADAFYYKKRPEGYDRLKSGGRVVIEDHVDIGSGSTIDRATLGATIIREGVKLDNQIQVAHNVELGENNIIVSQTGIAGSSKLGNNVFLGGQAGVVGHVSITDNVKVATRGGASKSTNQAGIYGGGPLSPMP